MRRAIYIFLLFLFAAVLAPAQNYVSLTWTAPVPNGDPVVGYNVYRSTSGSLSYGMLNSTTVSRTSYEDDNINTTYKYSYYVVSVDAEGVESLPSNIVVVVIPFYLIPPGSFQGFMQ